VFYFFVSLKLALRTGWIVVVIELLFIASMVAQCGDLGGGRGL